MRELFKALSELETRLMEQYGVSLNEAMALCCIGGEREKEFKPRKEQHDLHANRRANRTSTGTPT